jgi:hypothetical protein
VDGGLGAAENRKERGWDLGVSQNGKERRAGSRLANWVLGVMRYAIARWVTAYSPPSEYKRGITTSIVG